MQGVLFNLGFVNVSTEEHGLTHTNCFLILYIHKFKKKIKIKTFHRHLPWENGCENRWTEVCHII